MTETRNFSAELKALREEVAELRGAYAARAAAGADAGRKRFGMAAGELSAAIEAIKARIAAEAGEAGGAVAADIEELKRLVESYLGETEKTVSAHPLATLAGALAIGFLLGRASR